jgi:hypothetical protein
MWVITPTTSKTKFTTSAETKRKKVKFWLSWTNKTRGQPSIGPEELQGRCLEMLSYENQLLRSRNHYTAASLPIGVASGFPCKGPAKKILVYICQKQPHSLLTKLPNIMSMLPLKQYIMFVPSPLRPPIKKIFNTTWRCNAKQYMYSAP